MIAHQNVIAQCLQVQQITPSNLTKILAVLPAFHSRYLIKTSAVLCANICQLPVWFIRYIVGCLLELLNQPVFINSSQVPILINAEVYMLPAFTMKSMLDTVVKHQLKELLLVPPILIRLVRDPLVNEYDLSHLRRFSSGAAPLSEEIIQLLAQKFPQTGFKQGTQSYSNCRFLQLTSSTIQAME